MSPMGVVVSPKKIRINHFLTFQFSPSASSVNADTDLVSASDVELGTVLRDVVWRIV